MTSPTLPLKFQPYVRADLELPPRSQWEDLKEGRIFKAGEWILKLPRETLPDDSHLYRVRKAEKIRTYIQAKDLSNHIVVPEKYIKRLNGKNYVASKELSLSNEVAEIHSSKTKQAYTERSKAIGQVKAFQEGSNTRRFSLIQATALAELSFLTGYNDLTYNNFFFTDSGQVAIIDTEPLKRGLKKRIYSSWILSFLMDRSALHTRHSLAGTAKFKLFCPDFSAREAVEAIENRYTIQTLAHLVLKIALATLMTYLVPAAISLPLPATLLSFVIKLKARALMIDLLAVCYIRALGWIDLPGVKLIEAFERGEKSLVQKMT